uniref:Uncharacterized protein n=1 Tax=Setaria digitata TaxID=48799 RepID=A0A915PXB3_9BILA
MVASYVFPHGATSPTTEATLILSSSPSSAAAVEKIKQRQQAAMLDAWLAMHGDNLYPCREEKERLAKDMSMTYIQRERGCKWSHKFVDFMIRNVWYCLSRADCMHQMGWCYCKMFCVCFDGMLLLRRIVVYSYEELYKYVNRWFANRRRKQTKRRKTETESPRSLTLSSSSTSVVPANRHNALTGLLESEQNRNWLTSSPG